MARRRRNISVAVSPLMAWLQRFAVFLLIIVAVGMLVWNRMDARFGSNARMLVADVMSPLLNVFSRSSASVTQVTERFRTYEELAEENTRLRERIRILNAKAQTLDELLAENDRLRKMLPIRYKTAAAEQWNWTRALESGRDIGETKRMMAFVVADHSRRYSRSVLINLGRDESVRQGLAVVNDQGLVGRVREVGSGAARVLLITDPNSQIPVIIERAELNAFVRGTRDSGFDIETGLPFDYLRVEQDFMLPQDLEKIAQGDRVITSGADGVFPPGLLIGFISEITTAEARIRPTVDFDQLSNVLVVDYPGVDINSDLIAVGAVGLQTGDEN
jgi:rod shape-determining protein MreC